MSGVISLVLERDGHDQPWGFRLQGGADVAMPLSVQRILVGTPADGTLLKGDIILKISCTETKGITHQQAADLFNNAGNQIAIHIKRPGATVIPAGGQPATAAPLVNGTPVQAPPAAAASITPENPAVRSLPTTHFAHKKSFLPVQKKPIVSMETLSIQSQVTGSLQQIQQNQTVNSTGRLPSPNLQYNSPLPLYSAENAQEAMKPTVSPCHTPTINPSPIPANKPAQVILTPSKEYNPQSSATWRALQETDAPVDPEKIANYSSLKEHDPIYSEVYAAPVAINPGQRPPPRTNALPGPRSPVSELLPSSFKSAINNVEAQSVNRNLLSPPKTGPSAVLEAAISESRPVNHQMTNEPVKMPLYETNSIGGRRKIAQTASFNRLMMDVLGE